MGLLQTDQPLYLPEGSVRSLVAIAAVGAYIVGAIDETIPLAVIGFYFGARTANN